jgi:hypothetical protein
LAGTGESVNKRAKNLEKKRVKYANFAYLYPRSLSIYPEFFKLYSDPLSMAFLPIGSFNLWKL